MYAVAIFLISFLKLKDIIVFIILVPFIKTRTSSALPRRSFFQTTFIIRITIIISGFWSQMEPERRWSERNNLFSNTTIQFFENIRMDPEASEAECY